jgi:hypothetical protein
MSREFVYPVVTEVPRPGGETPPATAPELPWLSSQRELVEASLLRCPDTPRPGLGPYDLSEAR